MNISPINFNSFRTNFRGQYRYHTDPYSLKQDSLWHKNSSIEKTLGAFHSDQKREVYFANPMEPVSDKIKENVDYVVYDNEPSYPAIEDIEKNYLDTLRVNFREKFEEVREYFYRREMGGFANVEEAKAKQKEAAECTGMYDRAGDLRYKKETAEDSIDKLQYEKYEILQDLEISQRELKSQEKIQENINTHIANLEKLAKPYKEIEKIISEGIDNEKTMYDTAKSKVEYATPETDTSEEFLNSAYYNEGREQCRSNEALKKSIYEKTTLTYKDLNSVKDKNIRFDQLKEENKQQQENLATAIAGFGAIASACAGTIKEMKAHIASLQQKIVNIESSISSNKSFIEECKSKLTPLLNELKAFYTKQGIKGIKRGI